jgi:phage replication-related protein YjqB (UPF0714/DUF867 family)
MEIVLEELTGEGIPANISTDPELDGSNPGNICIRTTSGAGVQLEMTTTYRASLFAPGCNTRELKQHERSLLQTGRRIEKSAKPRVVALYKG